MDLEDWELLPDNSFKDHDEDHHGAMVMDYYLYASTQDPLRKTESPPRSIVVPKKLLQVPIAWEPVLDQDNTKIPNNPDLEPDPDPDSKQTLSTDSVSSPRVSFKIMKETEFADMKIDPPARITSPLPQINDAASKPSDLGGNDLRVKIEVILEEGDNDGERLKLWKVGLNGIGALCSFGVAAAAATVCVFFLGHNNIKICKNKNQMLRFQIYSDDNKRMKEAVNHATKLNEAIFGMKGVPSDCLLCASEEENRSHLFFECVYSSEVWSSFFTHPDLSPPALFGDIVDWVRSPSRIKKLNSICKLIFQAVVYGLWKERNSRLHSSTSKPTALVVKEIQLLLRAKLFGLDRLLTHNRISSASASPIVSDSFLTTWFRFIQR